MSLSRAVVAACLVAALSLGWAGGAPIVAQFKTSPPQTQRPDFTTYTDMADGYRLSLPSDMTIDESLAPIRVTFSGETAVLEVYHQPLRDFSLESYLAYSNKPILTGEDEVEVMKDEDVTTGGLRVRQLWWRRPTLARVNPDMCYYASVDISENPDDAYTLIFKATSEDELNRLVPAVVRSFKVIPASGTAEFRLSHTSERAYPLAASASALLQDYFGGGRQYWGIFEPKFPAETAPLLDLESQLNYTFHFVLHYSSMQSPPPIGILEKAAAQGRVVEETLQTLTVDKGNMGPITYGILNGTYDGFLRSYARSIAEFGGPVLFRLNNEMNGDWCGYSAYYSSKDASLYVAVWRYIFEIFHEEGADNALWVWNPNDGSFPGFKWNDTLLYYPGDEYVDIVGMTGYNTGTHYAGEVWRDFTDIYDPLYAEYGRFYPYKPLMITEFGSNSDGGDKVEWIREAFAHLRDYPGIKVAIWWNGTDWDGDKPARIYRLDQTPATLGAFREGLRGYPVNNE